MQVLGGSHVSFSVSDLDTSVAWYRKVFAAEVLMDEPGEVRAAKVLALPGTSFAIGLVEFRDREHDAFDPGRVGLDHFAFAVESEAAMHEWAAHLDAQGVEHSGVIPVPPGAILNFKDPDRIALALFWRR